tara:strand:- start:55 stop:519 length:465 start_codon:yes stop_codon:yes gene_type:complete
MSYMMNDLFCAKCEYEDFDAMYKRKDGPPKCPGCDTKLSIDLRGWANVAVHGHGPGSFAAVDFGVLGKAETKEDYDHCVRQIEQRFPGKRVQIDHETNAQKQTRLDTKRHESYQRKKAKSLDATMMKQIKTHNKRLKQEGRKPTKSASQLATGE